MQISANGIHLEVEDQGPVSGEPLLLIMGLGMQLIAWPQGLVAQLVQAGFRVIRFDNRDIGLSKSYDEVGVPNVGLTALQHFVHWPISSPYSLADMARDAVGVLDALGVGKAHVCGASMGGMIAQHLALDHASRVKSLTLMMTTSGARGLPQPSMKIGAAMFGKPADPLDFASVSTYYVKLFQLIGSPGYPTPEPELRQMIEAAARRGGLSKGTARQLLAIAADGSQRADRLAKIKLATLVIHGQDDPLVPAPAGQDLARRIPGASLDLIPGMGHDLPEPLWPRFVAGIKRVAGI